MKTLFILSLLFATVYLQTFQKGLCFVDTDGSCVEKCQYPKAHDFINKKCLPTIDECKTFIIKDSYSCVKECPEGYQPVPSKGVSYSVCLPCQYKDPKGNCYQSCPSPFFQDETTMKCIENPQECQGYFIKAKGICIKYCPEGFIAFEKETPRQCVSCQEVNQCKGNTGSDNTQTQKCTEKLSADKYSCGPVCPFGQYALPAEKGYAYQQCLKCPDDKRYVNQQGNGCVSQCEKTQAVNERDNNCIEKDQCETSIIEDKDGISWCVKYCPDNYAQETVEGAKYIHCIQCSEKQFIGTKKNCVDSCDIYDASGKKCLSSIKECIGFISSDYKKCLNLCPDGQYVRQGDINQYFCVSSCNKDEYILEKSTAYDQVVQIFIKNSTESSITKPDIIDAKKILVCLKQCPLYYYGNSQNKCISVKECDKYISIDGTQCLDSCPDGQFVVSSNNNTAKTDKATFAPETSSLKMCQYCQYKLSSDGKTCNKECAQDELYDIEQRRCIPEKKCAGIINLKERLCQNGCILGQQLLYVDEKGNKSCINFKECKFNISSDKQNCVSKCKDNEAPLAIDGFNYCVFCPLGVQNGISPEKTSCLRECSEKQAYDVNSKKCISQDSCAGYLSVSGKRCVVECEYPEVKSASFPKQCQKNCAKGEVLSKSQGCIAAEKCEGYISSDGQFCVEKCEYILEIANEDKSLPKTCRKCTDNQLLQVQDDKSLTCADKSSDNSQNIKAQADTIKKSLEDKIELSPAEKKEVKAAIQQVSKDIEDTIKQNKSSNLSQEDKKSQIKQMIDNIKDAAQQFISKIKSKDASANVQNGDAQFNEDDKLVVSSDEFQLVAEKKKEGFAFKVNLNLKDFLGSSPSLQSDTSSSVDMKSQTDSSIDSLTITNLTTNPHCQDPNKCASGFISFDATTAKRILESGSSQNFQITYDVDSSQINKTICVSYDESNGAMSLAETNANSANSQITCSFKSNSALYYDSGCQFVDSSNCPQNENKTLSDKSGGSGTGTNTNTSNPTANDLLPTSSLILGLNIIFSFILIIF